MSANDVSAIVCKITFFGFGTLLFITYMTFLMCKQLDRIETKLDKMNEEKK